MYNQPDITLYLHGVMVDVFLDVFWKDSTFMSKYVFYYTQ